VKKTLISEADEIKRHEAEARIRINLALIGICFTLFTFIIAINPAFLRHNAFVSVQLTLAIPFIITSTMSLAKMAKPRKIDIWNKYGAANFIIGYSFMINIVGILLSEFASTMFGMIFFAVNVILRLGYSAIEIKEHPERKITTPLRELFFITLLALLGILPSLGIY
jgi:hypothetical protein